MNEPAPRTALASAASVLRTIAWWLWRIIRYLAPLLLSAVIYLWRLGADLVHHVRVWRLRQHARTAPQQTSEFERRHEALQRARAVRWTSWQALTGGRRMAIRTAAVLMVVVVIAAFRFRPTSLNEPVNSPAGASTALPAAGFAQPAPIETARTFNIEAAAERFRRGLAAAAPGHWTYLSEGPVLAPGAPGDWDDFTVASPWVLRDAGDGPAPYRMWYRGCQVRLRERSCRIGHATSPDGVRWTKSVGPVFEPNDALQRRQLYGVTVARRDDRYFLWYSLKPDIFGNPRSSPLHLATSSDGLRWEAAGKVAEAEEQLPYPVEPSVIEAGGSFHLWFVDSRRRVERNDHAAHDDAPFLRHFTSADGRRWDDTGQQALGPARLGRVRVTVERGPDAAFRGIAFDRAGERWGRLRSDDGTSWDVDAGSVIKVERHPAALGEIRGRVTDATARAVDGGVMTWFVTSGADGREEIRVGFRKGDY